MPKKAEVKRTEKKKDFLEAVKGFLTLGKFEITPGSGFRKYKNQKWQKVATIKVKILDITKGFSLGAIATTAKDLGIVAGIKVGKTGFTLDAGIVAPANEITGLKKINYGFFVGGSITL
jgi:hypothetical protein